MLTNLKLIVWNHHDDVAGEIVFIYEDGDDYCEVTLPDNKVYEIDVKELLTVAEILVKAKTDAVDRQEELCHCMNTSVKFMESLKSG